MDFCGAFGLVLISVIMLFSAIIIGLVRHNVLLDPVTCCAEDTVCKDSLIIQHAAFYSNVTGLRLRYIIATCFLLLNMLQRIFIFPHKLRIFHNSYVTLFMGLTAFTTMLLFGDTANRFFVGATFKMDAACDAVSSILTDAINVLAWLVQILSCILFYLFIVTEKPAAEFVMPPFIFEEEDSVEVDIHNPAEARQKLVST